MARKTVVRKHRRKGKTIVRKHTRIIKVLKQTGKRKSTKFDRERKAFPPGRRVSRFGKRYTETRANRSDRIGKLL